jgi:segregation and condensation protein B
MDRGAAFGLRGQARAGTMGVRGKIEAVIYAADEPVTLAQLAALFAEEAIAERESKALQEPSGEQLMLAVEGEADAQTVDGEQISETAEGVDGAGAVTVGDGDADRRAARSRDRKGREAVRAVLDELMREYDGDVRGMEIREIAGGYRIATKPEYHDAVRAFVKSLKPVMKLSLQALETLAVIAYKQPVTAPEVSEIRGVDSGGVLGSLISRKLVTTAGRKQVVGRPILYKTTKEFLLRFGLKDLAELPSMQEFEKMAGELQAIGEETLGVDADEPVMEPVGAAPEGLMAVREGRPRTGPAKISISVQEPESAGMSVNRSGIPVRDEVAAHGSERLTGAAATALATELDRKEGDGNG